MNTQDLIANYITDFEDSAKELALRNFLTGLAEDLDYAPASTRASFHHAYSGGLLTHIVDIINIMQSVANGLDGVIEDSPNSDSIRTVAVLHDIHKACDISGNRQYMENILTNGRTSEKVPFKTNPEYYDWSEFKLVKDLENSPYLDSHGECRGLVWFLKNSAEIKNTGVKSLILIASQAPELMATLTESEINAIRHHGGAYEVSKYELQGKEDSLMILLHAADMLSSRNAAK